MRPAHVSSTDLRRGVSPLYRRLGRHTPSFEHFTPFCFNHFTERTSCTEGPRGCFGQENWIASVWWRQGLLIPSQRVSYRGHVAPGMPAASPSKMSQESWAGVASIANTTSNSSKLQAYIACQKSANVNPGSTRSGWFQGVPEKWSNTLHPSSIRKISM